MKTNKAVSKRLKVTKTGKLKRKAVGVSKLKTKHNNAQKMAAKKIKNFDLPRKIRARVLPKK